jgi:IS605 OrfB family transposase
MAQIIRRTSRLSLQFSNTTKLENLKTFISSYKSLVNQYINILWDKPLPQKSFIPAEIQKAADTSLPARVQQCAGKQALAIVRSQVNHPKKKKTKPVYLSNVVELDQRFIAFFKSDTAIFDEIFRFRSGDKTEVLCPLKHHSHFNKFKGWTRSKSVRMRILNNKLFLDVFFEKAFEPIQTDRIIGVDQGMNKLLVDSEGKFYGLEFNRLMTKVTEKKQKSKAYYRAIIEKNEYINRTIKELPQAHVVLEGLKNLRKDSAKGRLKADGTREKPKRSKTFRSKAQYYAYKRIMDQIRYQNEVVGVQCLLVSPAYTSQTCSVCGCIHELNRVGEIFRCVDCGHTEDADYNASKNILYRGLGKARAKGTTVPVMGPGSMKPELCRFD